MNIEKLSVNLRPRNRWEAVDLGFAMARQCFWQLWTLWVLVALPVALLLMAVAVYVLEWSAGWGLLLVWWFKPLYEQPLLFCLSRVLFGERLSVRQVFGQYRQAVSPQLLHMLTYRRFSFSRSFDNPVAMLERLRGKERSRRLTLLHRRQGSVAMWLTVLYVHVEIILQMSVMALLALLLPPEQELLSWQDLLFSDAGWMEWLNLLTYLLAASVVAPFYVAAGFVMYISRRAELEAWDIELQFRRLRQRVQQRDRDRLHRSPPSPSPAGRADADGRAAGGGRTGHAAGVVLMLALAVSGWTVPQAAQAQAAVLEQPEQSVQPSAQTAETAPQPAEGLTVGENVREKEKADARQQIETILAGEAFGKSEMKTRWKKKERGADESKNLNGFERWLRDMLDRLLGDDDAEDGEEEWGDFSLAAAVAEVLLWTLLAVVLAYVLYHAGRWANAMGWVRLGSGTLEKALPPTELFGLELRADSLPEDVPAQALRLLEQGEWRACLALLYRASLVRLIHGHGLDIRSSFTEQECERLVQAQRPDAQAAYFRRLTQQWLLLAYGHQRPPVERVRRLCAEWEAHFAVAQTADGAAGTDADTPAGSGGGSSGAGTVGAGA